MAEIKEVKLDKLDPNPFRDGSGGNPAATWDTVAEVYGFDEAKLKQLEESFQLNGVWAGVHVRPGAGAGRFQLAFGHHRIEAAKRAGLEKLPVIVEELSDDQMLQFMASENSEEYGHDFALGVMNAVEAVIQAHNNGKIELAKPIKTRFVSSLVNEEKPFTPLTVAQFLGWTHPDPTNGAAALRAADKVHVAVQALDLIAQGALKRNQLKGLGASQARELVTLTRRAMEAEAAKHELAERAYQERLKKAEKEGDKNTAKKMVEKVAEVRQHAEKASAAAGKAAAATVVDFHKQSESFSEAARKAAEALNLKKEAKPAAAPPKKLDLSGVDAFTEKLNATLQEDDPRWKKVLTLAEVRAARKTFKALSVALSALSERAKLRAKELDKVIG